MLDLEMWERALDVSLDLLLHEVRIVRVDEAPPLLGTRNLMVFITNEGLQERVCVRFSSLEVPIPNPNATCPGGQFIAFRTLGQSLLGVLPSRHVPHNAQQLVVLEWHDARLTKSDAVRQRILMRCQPA